MGLVSRYRHAIRSKKGKDFVRVVLESTDLPKELAMMGLEEEYRNFEAEYRDMVVTEDENATDFVYADTATVDLSNFMDLETEPAPTDVNTDVVLTYERESPEHVQGRNMLTCVM